MDVSREIASAWLSKPVIRAPWVVERATQRSISSAASSFAWRIRLEPPRFILPGASTNSLVPVASKIANSASLVPFQRRLPAWPLAYSTSPGSKILASRNSAVETPASTISATTVQSPPQDLPSGHVDIHCNCGTVFWAILRRGIILLRGPLAIRNL